jgi:hypothetical protein
MAETFRRKQGDPRVGIGALRRFVTPVKRESLDS